MKELILCICFLVFMNYIIPIIEAISAWMQNIFGKKAMVLQTELQEMQKELEPDAPSHAIGFALPDEPEYDEEDEDDE